MVLRDKEMLVVVQLKDLQFIQEVVVADQVQLEAIHQAPPLLVMVGVVHHRQLQGHLFIMLVVAAVQRKMVEPGEPEGLAEVVQDRQHHRQQLVLLVL